MNKPANKRTTISTGLISELGAENLYHPASIPGDSTSQAYEPAVAWPAAHPISEA
jgi:hypothetical protein